MTSNLAKPRVPLRELRKKLMALKGLDLRRADLDFLKKQLVPILHHYVHAAPLIQPGERIFRAVLRRDKPTHERQLTYPPAQLITTYGRVNRPGEPVFYGSVGSTAAIQELAPENGARLAISMWRVTRPIATVSLGYSEEVFAKLGSKRWSQIWWQRRNLTEPEPVGIQTPGNKLLNRFLAKEFTRRVRKGNEWQYKLSVAIAESYLKAQPASLESISGLQAVGLISTGESITGMEVGGLVYPSIATSANNDNIVLKCTIADSCLEFVWVHYIEISKLANKTDEFTPSGLDFADRLSASGEIQWIGSFPNVLVPGTDLRLGTDGSALVIKDSLNRTVGRFPEGGAGSPSHRTRNA